MINDHSSLLYECGLNPALLDFYPAEENSRDGLSRRDIAFCYLLSRGVPREEAFKVAYSAKQVAPAALREHASRRLKNEFIVVELQRLINTAPQPAPLEDPMWLQRTVIKDMLNIIQEPKNGPMARTRAGEILLRHIGMTVAEIVKLNTAKSEQAAVGVIEDIERILAENTGGPVTRQNLMNGKADDSLGLN